MKYNNTFFRALVANHYLLYLMMIMLGIGVGLSNISYLHLFATLISDIFIKIFKCISIPIIALSIIVTLANYSGETMGRVLRKTTMYTISTTVIAAAVSCLLYVIIQPANVTASIQPLNSAMEAAHQVNYWQYLATLIPSNVFSPFIESQVIGVLMIGIVVGIAIRSIPDQAARQTVSHFFKGMHALFIVITKWIVAVLPLGLFGFVTVTVIQMRHGADIKGIGEYLAVVVCANLIQGLVVLPTWLKLNNIAPFQTMRKMMPALIVAFFSKSSAGTLPVTMATAENRLHINPKISRFVLPLCTSINMNGCAAFIFATVIYLMQNHGIPITPLTMGSWIIIATIAALGNAGVPMGCFFLSASLLSSMDIPIMLMGIILPFYTVIDMLETALNVWSDSCVTKVIDQQQTAEGAAKPLPSPVASMLE